MTTIDWSVKQFQDKVTALLHEGRLKAKTNCGSQMRLEEEKDVNASL